MSCYDKYSHQKIDIPKSAGIHFSNCNPATGTILSGNVKHGMTFIDVDNRGGLVGGVFQLID